MFSRRPPTLLILRWGQSVKIHGHVAYQIKYNHKCSTMVANVLPTDPHPTALGV